MLVPVSQNVLWQSHTFDGTIDLKPIPCECHWEGEEGEGRQCLTAPRPQVADDFSQYQLARLVKRSRVSERLECVRRVLRSGEAAVAVGDMSKVHHVETNRVVSSDHTRYILVRGSGLESSLTNSGKPIVMVTGTPMD